jgi:ppGpp synthetase/RelA/SpoT-type nucleotidyltranferase
LTYAYRKAIIGPFFHNMEYPQGEPNSQENKRPTEIFFGGSKRDLDWKKKFRDTFTEILEKAGLNFSNIMPADFEEFLTCASDKFMESFMRIRMDDTLYDDVRDGSAFTKMASLASEIDLWTTGDIANRHQERKILDSTIVQKINEKTGNRIVDRNHMISNNKLDDIPATLDAFMERRKTNRAMVAVFDDTEKSLSKVSDKLKCFCDARNDRIELHTVLIRAMRGKNRSAQWELGTAGEASDLNEMCEIVKKCSAEAGFERDNVIIFLDFDGTLSDNTLTRERQKSIFQHAFSASAEEAIGKFCKKFVLPMDMESAKLKMMAVLNKVGTESEENDGKKSSLNLFDERLITYLQGMKARQASNIDIDCATERAFSAIGNIFIRFSHSRINADTKFDIGSDMDFLNNLILQTKSPENIRILQNVLAVGYAILMEYNKALELLEAAETTKDSVPSVAVYCMFHMRQYEALVAYIEKKGVNIIAGLDAVDIYHIGTALAAVAQSHQTETPENLERYSDMAEKLLTASLDQFEKNKCGRMWTISTVVNVIHIDYYHFIADCGSSYQTEENKEKTISAFLAKYNKYAEGLRTAIDDYQDPNERKIVYSYLFILESLLLAVAGKSVSRDTIQNAYTRATEFVHYLSAADREPTDHRDNVTQYAQKYADITHRLSRLSDGLPPNSVSDVSASYAYSHLSTVLYSDLIDSYVHSLLRKGEIQKAHNLMYHKSYLTFMHRLCDLDLVSFKPFFDEFHIRLMPQSLTLPDNLADILKVILLAKEGEDNPPVFGLLITTYTEAIKSTAEEYEKQLRKVLPPDVYIIWRIKSPESIFLKMLRERKTLITDITDIIGFSVFTDTEEEAAECFEAVNKLMRSNPQKTLINWDKPTSFGRRSMDLTGFFDGHFIGANIQIRTKEMERQINGNAAYHKKYRSRMTLELMRKMNGNSEAYLDLTRKITVNLADSYMQCKRSGCLKEKDIHAAYSRESPRSGSIYPFFCL